MHQCAFHFIPCSCIAFWFHSTTNNHEKMTSGVPLTENEKEMIRAEIKVKSKRQLAQELNRHRKTIKDFVDMERLEED